jgi:lysophospholipid acyltransferase 5
MTQTNEYDIDFSVEGCILVFKYWALTLDLSDGLGHKQSKSALKNPPSIVTLFGYTFAPFTALLGPIMPIVEYEAYVKSDGYPVIECESKDVSITEIKNALNRYRWKRVIVCIVQMLSLYMCEVFISRYIPLEHLGKKPFIDNKNLLYKIIWLYVASTSNFFKLIKAWKSLEASGYAGCVFSEKITVFINKDTSEIEFPKSKLRNCSIIGLFTSAGFKEVVNSMNITTNAFAREYLYKRCAFLKSKFISAFYTVFILAIWHGFHLGYFLSFFCELLFLQIEEQLSIGAKKSPLLASFENGKGKLIRILLFQLSIPIMHLPHAVLDISLFLSIMHEFYYIPVLIVGIMPLFVAVARIKAFGERQHIHKE